MNPKRARDQRWLANQRNCLWIKQGMEILTIDGVPALLAWARSMALYVLKSTPHAIIDDIIAMLSLKAIMIAIYFEAEVGRYFEVTMFWHVQCDESTRPGFRMMDVHGLLSDYLIPFWNKANTDPMSHFSDIFRYINMLNLPNEMKTLKIKQILHGIEAGRAKLQDKVCEFILVPPISFLLFVKMQTWDQPFLELQ